MKKLTILSLIILLFCWCLVASCNFGQAETTPTETSNADGFVFNVRVLDKETNRAIVNAIISLDLSGRPPKRVVTGSDGLSAVFIPNSYLNQLGKITVEANEYSIYRADIQLDEEIQIILLNRLETENITNSVVQEVFSSTLIINSPVENIVTANTIEALTVFAGDPPEVQQQKLEQRQRLVAAEVLYYISNLDARLGLVNTVLLDSNFDEKLRDVRLTVAPSTQEIFESAYNKLITKADIASLQQQLNSYLLLPGSSQTMLELVSDSDIDPSKIRFFYSQLTEVQWATESMLDVLSNIAELDSDDQRWWNYYQERLALAVQTLINRSETAHVSGLDVINDMQPVKLDADIRLKTLLHLRPKQLVNDSELHVLLLELLQEAETLNMQRTSLVATGQKLLDEDLAEYSAINEELRINGDDTWDLVVAKAISLRQLGRTEEAVAAFNMYEEMFTESDPTAEKYAQVARQFTKQISQLSIQDGAVYVFDITKDSPASTSGLAVGDIIVGFNDLVIKNMFDIEDALDNVSDSPVEITILRMQDDGNFVRQKITVAPQLGRLGIGMMPI